MKKIIYLILLIALSVSCKKDESNDEIPNVHVDFTMNLNLPEYFPLTAPGGWMYVTGGVKGIVIYRLTLNDFFAIERNCSYQPANGNRVSVDTTNTAFLRDDACGSKFNMINGGSVENGPATRPLKRYNATYDGSSMLHVYN